MIVNLIAQVSIGNRHDISAMRVAYTDFVRDSNSSFMNTEK